MKPRTKGLIAVALTWAWAAWGVIDTYSWGVATVRGMCVAFVGGLSFSIYAAVVYEAERAERAKGQEK